MKIGKKVILIIIASFLCISCMGNELNFELKIESELEEFYKEKISDVHSKKVEILLKCQKDN